MGMGTLWKRMASDGLMSIATVATVAMSLLLLAVGPIYADAVSLAAMRATLGDAPPEETAVGVSIRTTPTAFEAVDELVGATVDDATHGVDASRRRSLASGPHRVPSLDDGSSELSDIVVLRAVDGLTDVTVLVDGDWPDDLTGEGPGGTSGTSTVAVAVDERAARQLGVEVGRRVEIEPTGQGEVRTVEVAAIYRVTDPSDPYWVGVDDLLTGGSVSSRFRTHPFVTPIGVLTAAETGRLDAEWSIVPDVSAIDLVDVEPLRRGLTALERRLTSGLARTLDDPSVVSEFEVTTELDRLLAGTERSVTVTRSSVYGVVFQLAILATYALVLTAAIAVETRARESALLRSRGARPRDLAGTAALEAAAIAVPLAIAAPFVAAALLRLADDVGPLASIDLDLVPRPTRSSFAIAFAGAAAVVAVLVAPVLRGARRAEEASGQSREPATSASQRAGVDLALVVLAVVAFWQLATLDDERATTIRGRFGVDPILILAPALGLFTAAVIALRLVPPAARLGEVAAVRARGAVRALVGWQVARRPSRSARTSLLLIAAVSIGVLATTFTTSWRDSQQARAIQEVGADARTRPNRRTGDSIADLQLARAYTSVDGISATTAVSRGTVALPGTARAGALVGVGTDDASGIVRTHDAITAAAIADALDELQGRRPSMSGVVLDGDPRAVQVGIEVVEAETIIEDEPIEPDLTVSVEMTVVDGAGQLHEIELGGAAAGDGPTTVVVDMAPDDVGAPLPPLTIVAIETSWPTPSFPARTGTVSITGITTIDADGVARPVDGFDELAWAAEVTPLGFVPVAPTAVANATDDGVRMSIESGFGSSPTLVVASARPSDADVIRVIPVVVTERYLDESGSELGNRIRLDGLLGDVEQAEIVAAVPSFPTVDPRRNEAVIADLPTLQYAARAPGVGVLVPDEYWFALDGDAEDVRTTLEAAPFEVTGFVAETERLDELTTDPPAIGALGAMSIGFVAGSVFATIGFVVSAAVSARERADEFSTLRAIGLSQRQLARWLAAEQVLTAIVSTVVGLAIGITLSLLLLPRISLTERGEAPFPPVEVVVPWGSIVGLVVVVLGATALVVMTVFWQAVRLDRDRTRIGEIG